MLRRALVLAVLPLLAPGIRAQETTPTEPRVFARFAAAPDGGKVEALFTTYRRGDVTVHLYSALHVADLEFYTDLQKRFAARDALLYELIGAADLRPYPGMVDNPCKWSDTGIIQGGLAQGMQLHEQMDSIDYRQNNFVHADMTLAEFQAAKGAADPTDVGDDKGNANREALREAAAQQKQQQADLVDAFRSGRGVHAMRLFGAQLILRPEQIGEPAVLIRGRNEVCFRVLEEQLAADKKDIGIFYGAFHMAHMERRLVDDMGFRLTGEEWVMAWDCRAAKFPVAEKGLKTKIYRARKDLEVLLPVVQAWCSAHPGEAPTLATVRKAQPDGKLPGRNDGIDPWGREYVVRMADGLPEVRCVGSDGAPDSADDIVQATAPELPAIDSNRLTETSVD